MDKKTAMKVDLQQKLNGLLDAHEGEFKDYEFGMFVRETTNASDKERKDAGASVWHWKNKGTIAAAHHGRIAEFFGLTLDQFLTLPLDELLELDASLPKDLAQRRRQAQRRGRAAEDAEPPSLQIARAAPEPAPLPVEPVKSPSELAAAAAAMLDRVPELRQRVEVFRAWMAIADARLVAPDSPPPDAAPPVRGRAPQPRRKPVRGR